MSTTAKLLIRTFVREYTLTFPQEWEQFNKAMKEKRANSNDDFGVVQGADIIERKMHEIPETLYTIFKMKLNEEDWGFFQSKEGTRWFAKQFPEFRTSERT